MADILNQKADFSFGFVKVNIILDSRRIVNDNEFKWREYEFDNGSQSDRVNLINSLFIPITLPYISIELKQKWNESSGNKSKQMSLLSFGFKTLTQL